MNAVEHTSEKLSTCARSYYVEEDFNFYSNAYLKENLMVFAATLESLMLQKKSKICYLEIGVNKGLSSLAVHMLCEQRGLSCSIIGVDPYFENGYMEGNIRQIDKSIRDKALDFLGKNKVDFTLIEKTSREAYYDLIKAANTFDMVYIDGRHEKLFPLVDIGSYIHLVRQGGNLLIDDYYWRDVFQVKHLFDKYACRLCESWKIASYNIHLQDTIF